MLRVFAAMSVACAAAAIGQILVRHGMLEVGPLTSWVPRDLAVYFWRALTNPWVVGGTAGNAIFYFLFLAVLSWSDVTVALPLTALEYAFAAVLAVALLKETVPPLRWAGIALVIAGVFLIGLTQSGPEPPGPTPGKHGKDSTHEHTVARDRH